MEMAKSKVAVVVMSIVLGAFVSGCASLMGGVSPEESINQALAVIKEGFEAVDVDKVMTVYSEDFERNDGGTKEDAADMLHGYADQGYLDDLEVGLDNVEITVDGHTATAGPVEFSSSFGVMEFMYSFKKDADGVWRVTGTEQY